MDSLEIKIVDLINENLGMNASARDLFRYINGSQAKEIRIDFSNVNFMSRSFAQEYLFQKFNTEKNIIELNKPDDVVRMLEVVKKDYI